MILTSQPIHFPPKSLSRKQNASSPIQFQGKSKDTQPNTALPGGSANSSSDSITDILELRGNRRVLKKLATELAYPLPKTLSTSDRVTEVEQFALKLFQECQSTSALLKFAKMTGTQVYTAHEEPWIKGLIPIANGVLVYPNSLVGLPESSEPYDAKMLMNSLGNPKIGSEFREIEKKARLEKFPYITPAPQCLTLNRQHIEYTCL